MSSLQVLKGFISPALAEKLHTYFQKDAERIFPYYFASKKIRDYTHKTQLFTGMENNGLYIRYARVPGVCSEKVENLLFEKTGIQRQVSVITVLVKQYTNKYQKWHTENIGKSGTTTFIGLQKTGPENGMTCFQRPKDNSEFQPTLEPGDAVYAEQNVVHRAGRFTTNTTEPRIMMSIDFCEDGSEDLCKLAEDWVELEKMMKEYGRAPRSSLPKIFRMLGGQN